MLYSPLKEERRTPTTEVGLDLDRERKQQTVSEFRTTPQDTGSADVQVALLTRRIEQLSGHLKTNPLDHHSRRGLLQMVGRRRRLLVYLAREQPARYTTLISRLGLRR
ncbi:MAG: 30S ribosomal protein S15 [SAR202 cluster bacterium]|nr:30S ribosomal protein S15 [SAR202 cluster bacterium]